MTTEQNILINNVLDVINVHSESNLTLDTNTQLRFTTSNILIDYVPFDDYIRNVVFGTAITTSINEGDIHTTWEGGVNIDSTDNLIDVSTNTSELVVNDVYTSGVSATYSQINNRHHYINITANNNIYFLNNADNENVAYKRYTDSVNDQLSSLSNYIYNVINGNFKNETVNPSSSLPLGNKDITNKGVFIGNKITADRILGSDTILSGGEPILNLDSMTAINFKTNMDNSLPVATTGSRIYLGSDETGVSLDTYIKSQLDEDASNFVFGLNIQSGTEIVVSYINTVSGISNFFGFGNLVYDSTFQYTITYNMYIQDEFENGIQSSAISTNVSSLSEEPSEIPSEPPTEFPQSLRFTGLVTGTTYMLYATLLNNTTNTSVQSVLIAENIATIPNVNIISVTIINEKTIDIIWSPIDIDNIDEIVTFNAILDWNTRDVVSTPLLPLSTSKSQNLNNTKPTINYSFRFTISSTSISNDYNNTSYHLRSDVEHDVIIETQPYNMQVPYSLSVSDINDIFLTTLSGTNISISSPSVNNYIVSWNKPNSSNSKVTLFNYELFFGSNTMYSITETSSNGTYTHTDTNIVGNWYVKVNSLYNITSTAQLTSPNFTVVQPAFNIVSTSPTPNGNKTFRFTISPPTYNSNYNLSGTNLSTSTNSTIVNTSVLSSGTSYSFTIVLTDGLRLFTSQNTGANSINILTPSFSLSNPVFVSKPRIFSVSTSSFYHNGTLSSMSMSSVTNGNFYSSGSSNTLIKFQFNDRISSGNKNVTVVLTDSWGYTSTRTVSINLSIPFYLSNNTVSFNSTLSFKNNATVSNGSTIVYQWNVGGSSNIVVLDRNYSGSLFCTITETNTQGFTQSVVSTSITISQPNMSSSVFTIATGETSFTYNVSTLSAQAYPSTIVIGLSSSSSSYSNIGGEETLHTTATSISNQTYSTTLNKGTIYYLWGKITDNYGFGGTYRYLNLSYETEHIAPGPITLLDVSTAESVTHNSMTIYWEYGDMGTSTTATMTIKLTTSTGVVVHTSSVNYPTSSKLIVGLSTTTEYNVTITMTTNIDSKVSISGNIASGNYTTSIDFTSINLAINFNDFNYTTVEPIYIKLYNGFHDYSDFVSTFGRPVVWRETAKNAIDAYYNSKGIRKRYSYNNGLIIQQYNLASSSYGIRIFNVGNTQTHHFQNTSLMNLLTDMTINNDISLTSYSGTSVTLANGTDITHLLESGSINIKINIYPNKITSSSGLTEVLL